MAVFALEDAFIGFGALNLSGLSNAVKLSTSVDPLDVTTFGSETGKSKVNVAGLIEWGISVDGFADFSDTAFAIAASGASESLWDRLQDTPRPVSVAQRGAADGSRAYLAQGIMSSFTQLGKVGEACPYGAEFKSGPHPTGASGYYTNQLVRGVVGYAVQTQTVTDASAYGTTMVFSGFTTLTPFLVNAHIMAVSGGTSVRARLQFDDNPSFTTPASTNAASQLLSSTLRGSQTFMAFPLDSGDVYARVGFVTVGAVTFTAIITCGFIAPGTI